MLTDACVPVSELAGAIRSPGPRSTASGSWPGIVGHAGDGNFHLADVDPEDPASSRASDELRGARRRRARPRWPCTGEHGIGLGKIHALEQEHGDLLPLMQGVKRLFDPHGIMNPGKVLPAA